MIELEGNKYMLVNEIKNELPHIYPCATESSQQVLLFIVLTHIFMQEESCTEGNNAITMKYMELFKNDLISNIM